MTKVLVTIITIFLLVLPAEAQEISAPEVPQSGSSIMPHNTDSFADGLRELIQNATHQVQPELKAAAKAASKIIFSIFLFSLLSVLSEKQAVSVSIAGTVTISAAIFQEANTLIEFAANTVWEICEYGKLLCPVLTTALAAQGAMTSSATLYTGTVIFLTLLNTLVSRWIIPLVYFHLIFATANCALGDELLKKFADAIKNILQWLLKTILIIFTTYMTVTGTVSGMTDVAAIKAAKLTMSTVVPVVGGILSDASESVLVGMGVIKNTAGVYGILATLAVFLGPFIKVGVQYLMLKLTALICSLFPGKNFSGLSEDFSSAMGLLLAMVAVSCILVLISTVCFLKGIG